MRSPGRDTAARVSSARQEHITVAVNGFRRIVRALRVAEQRTQTETGVSAAQQAVLFQLHRSASGSLSELARRTLTDRSSVADVVERLEARRLVRRARGNDKRRTTIVITPAGRMLLRRAPVAPTSLLVSALATLDDAVLTTLASGIERLSEALGDMDEARAASTGVDDRARAPRIARRGAPTGERLRRGPS